jgi:hypothetical protein
MTLGVKVSQAPKGNEWLVNMVNNLTALGSSQGTAYVIPAGQDGSIFTTVAASTGAILPGAGVAVGEEYVIANHGANALSVYPQTGGKMGTASANSAYSLAAGKTGYFMCVGQGNWTVNP